MKNGLKVPILAIPALLVTIASLLILLATIAGAARDSQPDGILFEQSPALQLQLIPANDSSRLSPAQKLPVDRVIDRAKTDSVSIGRQPSQDTILSDDPPATINSTTGSTTSSATFADPNKSDDKFKPESQEPEREDKKSDGSGGSDGSGLKSGSGESEEGDTD